MIRPFSAEEREHYTTRSYPSSDDRIPEQSTLCAYHDEHGLEEESAPAPTVSAAYGRHSSTMHFEDSGRAEVEFISPGMTAKVRYRPKTVHNEDLQDFTIFIQNEHYHSKRR